MSQIIRDITEIARCGAEYRAVQLTPMGLKGCHASYLSEICADPGISQDKLAQRICINKSNIARQVAFLEEEGFVTRSPAPQDKRVMQLYPTEKTLALLPQITAVPTCWEDCITKELTGDEVQLLTLLLAKMKVRATQWMEAH